MQRHKFLALKIIFILMLLLPLMKQQARAQKKPSKYPNGVPITKGTWFSSLTFSAGSREAENESQLFYYVVDQDKSNLEIRLDPGYVIRENLAVGMGLLYGYQKESRIQRNSDGTLTDYRSYQRNFAFRPYVKNFIPLGSGNRFYVVIPTELQFGYGSRVQESLTDAILARTYTSTFFYGLEMRPGLLAFIVENFGFEVNVGAFGLSSSIEKIKKTNEPDGQVKNNDLSLKINLLQLSFGFAAYFNR
jgi:hypothetical protein